MPPENTTSTVGNTSAVGRFISITAYGFLTVPLVQWFLINSMSGGFKSCIESGNPATRICLERTVVKPGSPILVKSAPSPKSAAKVPPGTLQNISPNLPPPPVVLPVPFLPPVGGELPAR